MKNDADDGDRHSGMLDMRHKMTLSPVISLAAAIIIHRAHFYCLFLCCNKSHFGTKQAVCCPHVFEIGIIKLMCLLTHSLFSVGLSTVIRGQTADSIVGHKVSICSQCGTESSPQSLSVDE